MALLRKVKKILAESFPPPDKISLQDDDGLIGVITSERFKGMDSMDRQNWIGEILKAGLTPEEKRRILAIVAVTPEEAVLHTNGRPAR